MIVFHGDNLIATRNALNSKIMEAKRAGIQDIVRLAGETLELPEFKQALESESLFGTDRLIIIENFFSRKSSKAKDDLINYLRSEKKTKTLLVWEGKILTPSQIKKIPPSAKILTFKVSPKIFKFLDALAPKNTKAMLILLDECTKQESAEMIFYMLSRRVSDLIIARDLGEKGLDGMQHWQKSRLIQQAKKFSLPKLLFLHKALFETDKKVKTGKSILPLSSMLDLLIAEI